MNQKKINRAIIDAGLLMPTTFEPAATAAFSAAQLSYIQSRAAAHNISSADVLAMLPKNLLDNPDAAIRFLKDAELSHVVSQANAPWLASDPDNIVLELADGTNQARGSMNMDASDLHQVNAAANAHALDIDPNSLNAEQILGSTFFVLHLGNMAQERISPATKRACCRFVDTIRYEWRNLTTTRGRAKAAQQLASFIEKALSDQNAYAVVIMGIAIVHCPWLSAMLAMRGLVGLARIAAKGLRDFCSSRTNGRSDPFFNAVDRALNIAYSGLQLAADAAFTAAQWTADLLASTFKAGKEIVQKAWKGLLGAAQWVSGMLSQKRLASA